MIAEVTVTLTLPANRLAELQAFCEATDATSVATPKAKPKAKPKTKAKAKAKLDDADAAERAAIEAEGSKSADDKEARFAEAADAPIDRKQLEADLRSLLPEIGTEALREAKNAAGITVRLQAAEGDDLRAYRKLADDLMAKLENL